MIYFYGPEKDLRQLEYSVVEDLDLYLHDPYSDVSLTYMQAVNIVREY